MCTLLCPAERDDLCGHLEAEEQHDDVWKGLKFLQPGRKNFIVDLPTSFTNSYTVDRQTEHSSLHNFCSYKNDMGRNKSSTGICTEHLMSHCGFLSWTYLHHFHLASCRKRFSVNRDTRDSHFICSECARRSTSLFFITFLSCERNYATCFGWIPLLSLNFWIPHFATDTLYGRLGFILSTQWPYMPQAKSLLISRNIFMTNALSSCQFFFFFMAGQIYSTSSNNVFSNQSNFAFTFAFFFLG